jgi:hypothetical protein
MLLMQHWWNICISAVPVLVLGTTLLLQAIITILNGQTRILTWSSSPLDTAAAILPDGGLTQISGRYMHIRHLIGWSLTPALVSP